MKPCVGHHRHCHRVVAQFFAVAQIGCCKCKQMIAVHNIAGMITSNHSVAVAIKCKAHVGLVQAHRFAQRVGVCRTAFGIDVLAIWLAMNCNDFGAKAGKCVRGNIAHCSVGAIQHHPHTA